MQHQLIQNWSTLAMITDTDSKPHVFLGGGGKSDYTHFGTTLFWLSTKKKKRNK